MSVINPTDFKVVIIGAGNVATRLGLAIKDRGYNIVAVAARTDVSAKKLAEKLSCKVLNAVSEIPSDCDLVLIATTDAAISTVAENIPQVKGFVAHTSGSIPLSVLATRHQRAAVIYPLQTFSKDIDVDVTEVPFFTEATDKETLAMADAVVGTLSHTCKHADSSIRAKLHVAGVLSSNFPIYLLEMTKRVLAETGLPLSTVQPLVYTTIAKAFAVGPQAALTGPARRGDVKVIEKQLNSLCSASDKAIYTAISDAILNDYHKKHFRE